MKTASDFRMGSPNGANPCGPGFNDVGDDVGDAEGDRGLHGTVEAHDIGLHPDLGQVLAH